MARVVNDRANLRAGRTKRSVDHPAPSLSLLVFQGLREYLSLVHLAQTYAVVLVLTGLLAAPVALVSLHAFLLLPFVLFIVGTLQPLLFADAGGVRSLAFAALGWGYVSWFLAHLMLLDTYVPGGQGILLALGLGVALSDVGAFAIGKTVGRHKVSPRLSPTKTLEGVLGNFVGAYLGIGIMAFALPSGLRATLLWILPPLIAIGSLWCDLLESSMKREFAVNDAGAWLPGFGGLLNRIDSLIMVGPPAFYLLKIFE
ncbi:MAG: hypothetical protein NVS4B2_24630 [Chloroflexota bacterium]